MRPFGDRISPEDEKYLREITPALANQLIKEICKLLRGKGLTLPQAYAILESAKDLLRVGATI